MLTIKNFSSIIVVILSSLFISFSYSNAKSLESVSIFEKSLLCNYSKAVFWNKSKFPTYLLLKDNLIKPLRKNSRYHYQPIAHFKLLGFKPDYIGSVHGDLAGFFARFSVDIKDLVNSIESEDIKLKKITGKPANSREKFVIYVAKEIKPKRDLIVVQVPEHGTTAKQMPGARILVQCVDKTLP